MYVSDIIITRFIARKHRRENGSSLANLTQTVKGYRDRLETSYHNKVIGITNRNINYLKKRIGLLDIDHQNFLDAMKERVSEIRDMEGVSEHKKEILINRVESSILYVIVKNRKIELVLDRIIRRKSIVCNKANKKIDNKNTKIKHMQLRFKYKFSYYISVLTKQINISEMEQIEANFPITKLHSWDYKSPKSLPDDEYEVMEGD